MERANINNVNVGDGVTVVIYTDMEAYTIVAKTAKSIKIQKDDAKLDNWKPEIIPGGFAGHCVNQDSQKYTYTQNKENSTMVIYADKDGNYKQKGYRRPNVYLGRKKYYDYNF